MPHQNFRRVELEQAWKRSQLLDVFDFDVWKLPIRNGRSGDGGGGGGGSKNRGLWWDLSRWLGFQVIVDISHALPSL